MKQPRALLNPKNAMICALFALFAYGILTDRQATGLSTIQHVAAAAGTAVILDLAAYRIRNQPLRFPDSALITGLIIGLMAGSLNPIYSALTSALAILSKHVLRYEGRHVFNPANFGLVAAAFLYPAALFQSWWAAANPFATAGIGLVNVWRLNRWAMMAAFLVPYAVAGFFLEPRANVFAGGAVFFFAFFMVLEPMTSPMYSEKSRVIFGLIAAVLALVVENGTMAGLPELQKYGFPAALLLANLIVPLLDRRPPAARLPGSPSPTNPAAPARAVAMPSVAQSSAASEKCTKAS